MRIAVLGAGAWGTALAKVFAENGHDTGLWTWQVEHARSMVEHRENREFLPGVQLPEKLAIGASLEQIVSGAELLLVVVPSQAVRSTIEQAASHLGADCAVVCASKGIETGTLQLMTEVIADVLLPSPGGRALGVVSGPSFAKEVAARVPTNLVAASLDPALVALLQNVISTPWLRTYSSPDPVGVEIGGALKNVIAIAAGGCDGLGLGHNTRAALITRGVAEMTRLVARKGGQVLTMAGLAGMGDLVLTCTGEMSRNRTLGVRLGAGMSLDEALASSSGIAEGYATAKSAHDLAERLEVELPICEAVYSVLYEGRSTKAALQTLLSRPLRSEWESYSLQSSSVNSTH